MIAYLQRFLLLFLGLGLATRLYIASFLPVVPAWVWAMGLWNDVLAAALLIGLFAPVVLISNQMIRRAVVAVAVVVMLVVAAAETFYWIEFESRLDRLVFHYLAYPVEVLVFLDEQFYVTWALIPLLLIAYLVAVWLNPPYTPKRPWLFGLLGVALLTALFARQGVPDDSRHLNQAASNGYIGVLTAAMVDVRDAEKLFPGAKTELATSSGAASNGLSGMHVVLIIEESMAGPNWVDPIQRVDVFSQLSKLAEQGVLFDHAYATGTRTTRGMEAILNGFPPLPGISTTERSGFERLPSLARAFRGNGYHTVFAYGGWPDFSNFTNYWRGTGYAETTSREDFPDDAFMTSWGASDDDLFRFALERMDERVARHDRVFMTMLTVSHHRPFELPPSSPYAGGRAATDALRYADAALGRFFAAAKSKPWFGDTLFVVVADHGPKIAGDRLIPVSSYRVPLLLFAPERLPPQLVSRPVSAMSLPRTIANLVELEHSEPFWGTDLLAGESAPLPVEHDYHVGWIEAGELKMLTRDGRARGWDLRAGKAIEEVSGERISNFFRSAHEAYYDGSD